MSEQNHSGNYNHIRCLTCGCAWLPGVNALTGEMEAGHPDYLPCNRYRPSAPAPPSVGEAIERHGRRRPRRRRPRPRPPTIDDADKSTREWAANEETYDHV